MAKNGGKPKRQNNTIWWVTGVAVVAVGLLVAVSIYSSKPKETAGAATTGGTQVAAAKTDAESGAVRNVKGADSAPVKVVEFGDFQ